MKRRSAVLASQQITSECVDKISQERTNKQKYQKTNTIRKITEHPDGSREIEEKEEATSQQLTQTEKASIMRKNIESVMNTFLHGKPAELLAASQMGRKLYQSIEHNRAEFCRKFPFFMLNGLKTNREHLKQAITTYACAPLVDFSWKEIIETGFVLTEEMIDNLIVNKLLWKAACETDEKKLEKDLPAVNDSDVQLVLISADIDRGSAVVRLIIPEHKKRERVDITVQLLQVDAFILKLLPDANSRARITSITNCMAQNALAEL